jgi:aryl-alcohol dehydrogenase-like predicted oxidoreductase
MVELSELSKAGFGAYKVTIDAPMHREALETAVKLGCNLIDTAPNYTLGKSELLIGKVLTDTAVSKKQFIISKVGYIQGEDIQVARDGHVSDRVKIGDGFEYSICKDFIKIQLKRSMERLGRKYIDGYLLHNPEHYFGNVNLAQNKEFVYKKIFEAFSFLEDMVQKKLIRYYGVSSNTLPMASSASTTLDLYKLMEISKSISTDNHFKLIQFPFNIIEREAVANTHSCGKSLLSIIKESGLVSFGNRPLNARVAKGALRLATYDNLEGIATDPPDTSTLNSMFELILSKLRETGMENSWQEFPILNQLKAHWDKMGNPESVDVLFVEHFLPFIDSLYDGDIDPRAKKLAYDLRNQMKAYSRKKMTEEARALEKSLIENNTVAADGTPFAYRICKHYLAQGIDHLLIGMRSRQYVEDFSPEFRHNGL